MLKKIIPLYLTAVTVLIIIQAAIAELTGLELLIALLDTRYNLILISFLVLINSIIIFSIYKTVFLIKKSDFEKLNPLTEYIKSSSIFFISMALLLAGIIYYDLIPFKKNPTAPDQFIYTSEPFVQMSSGENGEIKSASENMTVWWFSSDKNNFIFNYGKDPDEKLMKQADIFTSDKKRFSVDLTGLEASQKYYYRISGLSGRLYHFKTAPQDNSGDPVRILSVGDTRTGKDKVYSFYNEILATAENIYKKTSPPDLKLNAGDIIHNGNDFHSWKYFFETEKIHSPYIPGSISIGNHELKNDSGKNYDYFFSLPRYFSFSWGNVQIINLNTYDGILNTAGGRQYKFLKTELEKYSGKKWIIVTLHNPILSTGDYNMNRLLIAQFYELFRKQRVDLVIAGHDHHFDAFLVDGKENWGGTFYIVNGGGGAKIDSMNLIRKNKRWKNWIHDRNSGLGLYQDDELTKKYHIYGESAWGFADIKITSDEMVIDYYRWLGLEKYLDLSGQNIKKWNPMPLDADIMKKNGLEKSGLILSLKKKRTFQR